MYSLSVCRSRGYLAYVIHNNGIREALCVEEDVAETSKERLETLVDFHIKGLNKLAVMLEEQVNLQEEDAYVVLETTSKKVSEWLTRSNISKEDEVLSEALVVAFNKLSMPVSVDYVGFEDVRAARYTTSKFLKEGCETSSVVGAMNYSRAVDIF